MCFLLPIKKKLKILLSKHKNIFADKEFQQLNEADYNTSNFQGLPKIHKSQLKTNAIKEQNSEAININKPQELKVRPIVEEPNYPTRTFGEVIDTLLKPFLKHQLSLKKKRYIRDSIDFLNKCG